MKFKIKQFFNMIEVTLAIGILAMGATAVLALFPLGIDRNKSSIGENYCAEAASSLLAYVSSMAIATDGWNDLFGAGGDIPGESSKATIPASSRLDNGFSFSNVVSGDVFTVSDNGMNENNGLYGIKVETFNYDETSLVGTDFTGEALLWYETVGSIGIAGNDVDIDSDIAVKVNLEISWPVTTQYRFRKKNNYTLDLFNYNPN